MISFKDIVVFDLSLALYSMIVSLYLFEIFPFDHLYKFEMNKNSMIQLSKIERKVLKSFLFSKKIF